MAFKSGAVQWRPTMIGPANVDVGALLEEPRDGRAPALPCCVKQARTSTCTLLDAHAVAVVEHKNARVNATTRGNLALRLLEERALVHLEGLDLRRPSPGLLRGKQMNTLKAR